jgi:hypothetical protein
VLSPRLAVLPALAALALAGCDGRSAAPAAPAAASEPATAAPRVAAAPLTPARAQELATAAILVDGDVPGYTATRQTLHPDAGTSAALKRCLGVPPETYLWSDAGTSFTKGNVQIDSTVDVARSVAAAQTEITAQRGPQGGGCDEDNLKQALYDSGAAVESTSSRLLPVSVEGADDSFVYELSGTSMLVGRKVAFHGFEIGALIGQVEIGLTVAQTGSSSYPVADALALVKKAVDRVRAA